jgi:antitoxin component YwqK of YwqJK toxin-antitoxin module
MAEVRREYYSTGELKYECFEINGKKEGEYLSY